MSPKKFPKQQPPTDKKETKKAPRWDDFRSKESLKSFEKRRKSYGERIEEYNEKLDSVTIRANSTILELRNKADSFPADSRQRKFYEAWYKRLTDAGKKFNEKNRLLDRLDEQLYDEKDRKTNWRNNEIWREVRDNNLREFQIPGQNMWEESVTHVLMERKKYVDDINSILDRYSSALERETEYTGKYANALQPITDKEIRELHVKFLEIEDGINGTEDLRNNEELRQGLKKETLDALHAINKEGSLLYMHRDSPFSIERIEHLLKKREELLSKALGYFPGDLELQYNLAHVRNMNRNYLRSRAVEEMSLENIKALKDAGKKERRTPIDIAKKYMERTRNMLKSDASDMVKVDIIDKEIAYIKKNKIEIEEDRIMHLTNIRKDLLEKIKDIKIDENVARLQTPEGSSPENIEKFRSKCYETARFLRAHLKDADTSDLFYKYREEYKRFKEWKRLHDSVLAKLSLEYGIYAKEIGARIVVAKTTDTGFRTLGDERVVVFSADQSNNDHRVVIEKAYKGITEKNLLRKKVDSSKDKDETIVNSDLATEETVKEAENIADEAKKVIPEPAAPEPIQ